MIELVVHAQARAYPLQVLVWHEIANDTAAGVPVAVTFCPLCNTALVFDRRAGGRALSFGTTGNLLSSELVMYDRQSESWWLQFGGEGVVGRYAGARLRQLPARIVGWAESRRAHPAGLVLTRHTGYRRPYGDNPYAGYENVNEPPLFAAAHENDRRLPPRERVVFVEVGGESVAVLDARPATRAADHARWATVCRPAGGRRRRGARQAQPARPLLGAVLVCGRRVPPQGHPRALTRQ